MVPSIQKTPGVYYQQKVSYLDKEAVSNKIQLMNDAKSKPIFHDHSKNSINGRISLMHFELFFFNF